MNKKHLALVGLLALAAVCLVAFARDTSRHPGRGPRSGQRAEAGHVSRTALSTPARAALPDEAAPGEDAERDEDRVGVGSVGDLRREPRDRIAAHLTRLVGRVVDADGAGVPGAAIEILSARGSATAATSPLEPRTISFLEIEAGHGGGFVAEVPATAYRLIVRASAPDFVPLAVEVMEPVGGDTTDVGAIELLQAGYVEGIVVDAAGNGVEGAEVFWRADFGSGAGLEAVAPERRRGVTTDAAGRFHAADVPAGRVRFAAATEHAASAWTHPYRVEGLSRETMQTLRELGYRTTQEVRIQLVETGRVRGRVLDAETGEPVEARVVASPAGLPGLDRQLAPPLETRADEEGRFRIAGLMPDVQYTLFLTASGYRDKSKGGLRGAHRKAGPELLYELHRAALIRVHVRDAETLEPIAGALLSFASGGARDVHVPDPPWPLAVTDEHGDATLPPCEERDATLRCDLAGYHGPHRVVEQGDGLHVGAPSRWSACPTSRTSGRATRTCRSATAC